jgi:hypothetical protein
MGSYLQLVEVGSPPGMVCMVPQPYAAVGNRLYPGVLGHNWRPTVPGVAPEPSVEWGWLEPITRRWAEQFLIWYCGHFRVIHCRDYGAKSSMILTRNLAVVCTV